MLTAQDLMTTRPLVTNQDASIGEVLRYMQADGIRHMPVLDAEEKLVGIITDRDIRLAMNSERLNAPEQNAQILAETLVTDCMTSTVFTVDVQTPAYEIAEMFSTYKFGALPVVDGNFLVGIVTITDILDEFAKQERGKL